jgi:hypothetical protein
VYVAEATGAGSTVTVIGAEVPAPSHAFALVTVTEYVPLDVTVIDCVVPPPLLQTYDSADDDVKTTDSPLHISVAEALTVGIGALLTLTEVGIDVAEHPFPSIYVTVYDPEVVTVIDELVSPEFDQTFPVG